MSNPVDHPQEMFALPMAGDLLELANRPIQIIAHRTWSAAHDQVLGLVAAGPTLVAVLGPPGSGKTTLLRELATTLDEHGRVAAMVAFGDSPFEVEPATVVLVDEADRMSTERLDELYSRGDVAIVLAALPAFAERLKYYPDLVIVQLSGLSPDEACAFVAEQLAQLGLPVGFLTEAAWARLITYGGGVPRLLVALLRLTLFVAAEDNADRITELHVEAAVEVRSGGAGGAKLEPPPAEQVPDADQSSRVPVASPDVRLGQSREAPPRRHGRVAGGVLVAACLFAIAVFLPVQELWQNHETPLSGTTAPAIVGRTDGPTSLAATDGINAIAPASTGPAPNVTGALSAGQDMTDSVAPVPPEPVASASLAGTLPSATPSSPAPPLAAPANAESAAAETPPPASPPSEAIRTAALPTESASPEPPSPPPASLSTEGPQPASPSTVSPSLAVLPAPASPQPASPSPASPSPAPPAGEPDIAASPNSGAPARPPVSEPGTVAKLPAGSSIRVVLTYPRGDAAAAERADDVARLLRADGLGVGDPFPVGPRAPKQGISYYFAQDEGAAAEIGRRLHGEYGEARLVRLSRNAGLPRPGTIEVAMEAN